MTGKRRTGRRLNEPSICHIQYEPQFFFYFGNFVAFLDEVGAAYGDLPMHTDHMDEPRVFEEAIFSAYRNPAVFALHQ